MSEQPEDKLLQQIRQTLDAGVERVDSPTRQRLHQVRQRALRSGAQSAYSRLGGSLVAYLGVHPALRNTVLAASVLLAVLVVWQLNRPDVTAPFNDELMLLSVQDDLELFEQLEFLEWLSHGEADNG